MPTYDKEYIIRYVDDEMDDGERQQFEADLQNDPALGAEVALYRELKATLRQRLAPDAGTTALQDTLSAFNKEYFKKDTGAKRILLTRWVAGMAAAASVIIATVLLWPSDNKDLYQRLANTQMVGVTERGGNTDTLMQEAAVYFNRQEFAKALPLLDQAVKADTTNQLALFYRGVAGWHTGAVTAARNDLEKVYVGHSLLRYEAAFYLALSYAAEKNTAAALEWLHKIPAGTPVSDRAKELETNLK
ncbi:tetratricopeptide repeat protein [Puia dinghuensis]|uniref:Tetratricopeptide repeat protein n=1 Tax=Puia dinghuensis TaxID=1792502 RepID=A0A8J2UG34_9BACT|nr:tetratricopeptide repeat protein [Puia dinghuensis]GGB12901.1 hypothetical protein GCM10011511_40690 [Puia dinghuensis]